MSGAGSVGGPLRLGRVEGRSDGLGRPNRLHRLLVGVVATPDPPLPVPELRVDQRLRDVGVEGPGAVRGPKTMQADPLEALGVRVLDQGDDARHLPRELVAGLERVPLHELGVPPLADPEPAGEQRPVHEVCQVEIPGFTSRPQAPQAAQSERLAPPVEQPLARDSAPAGPDEERSVLALAEVGLDVAERLEVEAPGAMD